MGEVGVEEGLDPAVEGLHDGEVGAFAADVEDEVDEDEGDAE